MFRRLQSFLKDYFTFTTRERRGVIVLMVILLLVIAAPYFWNKLFPPKMKPLSEFRQQITLFDSAQKKSTYNPDSVSASANYTETKGNFVIEINAADSTSFLQIQGIRKYIAARIVKYRHALGGFYSVSQLKEVYGLKPQVVDSNMKHFSVDVSDLRKISINTEDESELKHHPYIGYSLAKVIVAYREQHGNFKATSDLKNIAIVTDDVYKKLLPYITVK